MWGDWLLPRARVGHALLAQAGFSNILVKRRSTKKNVLKQLTSLCSLYFQPSTWCWAATFTPNRASQNKMAAIEIFMRWTFTFTLFCNDLYSFSEADPSSLNLPNTTVIIIVAFYQEVPFRSQSLIVSSYWRCCTAPESLQTVSSVAFQSKGLLTFCLKVILAERRLEHWRDYPGAPPCTLTQI